MKEVRLDLFKLYDKNDVSFLSYFWIEHFKQEDFNDFKIFKKLKKLDDGQMSTYKLAKTLDRSYMTIHNWRNGNRLPKIAHWLIQYKKLGEPKKNNVWLWLNSKNDFTFTGMPIQVPLKVNSWNDIKYVLEQLSTKNNNKVSIEECFAFVVGMMMGDVGKLSKNRDRLDLQLTKNVDTNKKLGEFFCSCIDSFGLKTKRIKDSRNKFRWLSQSSLFFKWIYNKVLGLKDENTTTYDPVKIEWIFSTPLNVKRRLLQGVFESDGSVLYDGKITCASFPNSKLIGDLVKDFGIKSHIVKDGKWKRLGIEGITQLTKSFDVLFAPEIKTKRYKLLEKIIGAEKVNPPAKTPKKIKNIIKLNKNLKNYQILKILINKHDFYTSRTNIKRIKNEKR